MTGGARPARLSRTAQALVAVAGALWVIARTTGSGWVVVVVCAAAGLLAVGAVGPLLVLRRTTVRLDAAGDGIAGAPLPLHCEVSAPAGVRMRCLTPAGDWVAAHVGAGVLPAAAERRGVLREIALEVESAHPLGLVWWRRRLTIPLRRPLFVAPRVRPWHGDWPAAAGQGDDHGGGAGGLADVRSVRPYRPGDQRRMVHWATSARRGHLVVKELDGEPPPGVALTPDLRGGPDRADEVAGHTLGAVQAALIEGRPVWLLTTIDGEAHAERIADVVTAGRRLAVAAGGPTRPPSRLPAQVVTIGAPQ